MQGVLRGIGGVGRLVWPVVCLFQLGLLAGFYFSQSSEHSLVSGASHSDDTPPENDERTRATRTAPVVAHNLGDTTQADDFLKRGWYEQALALYESAAKGRTGDLPDSLHFKMALCLNGLGHWDQAVAEFGDIAGRQGDSPIATAARLARARLLFRMRNLEESKRALGELLLQGIAGIPGEAAAIAEMSQLLGLTLALEALGKESPGPASETTLAFPELDMRPELEFIWNELPVSDNSADPAKPESLDAWPTGPASHDCDVRVKSLRGTIAQLIGRVADSANITCVWTNAARERAERRTIEISTGRLRWPVVIACLVEPIGIAWELRGDELHLDTYSELNDDSVFERRSTAARTILTLTPKDVRSDSDAAIACLALGNLEFATGRTTEAIKWFERISEEYPRSAQCVRARFNLGMAHRTLRDYDAARQSFLDAVDTAPTHMLAPLAHFFVGRMCLDQCDPEGAIAPLRRAVSMTSGVTLGPAAAANLATAMMLSGNWRAANTLLTEHRVVLEQSGWRETAAFLAAYSRYRTQTDRKQLHREGQSVVSSLMGLSPETTPTGCGVLLVGRAYADIGLGEKMVETFEAAMQRGVPKPVADEISYELAEFAYQTGKRDEAIRHFTRVFENARPARSREAGKRIAEIALEEQRTDDCLRMCRQLLANAGKADVPPILRLMGKAFGQVGDNNRAAQCFAGQIPAS